MLPSFRGRFQAKQGTGDEKRSLPRYINPPDRAVLIRFACYLRPDRVVLNAGNKQSNGAKQLYVNRKLVYSIKKDCTDGNLDTYVLSLPFGKTVLMLTAKLFSSSGFMYTLTLGVGKGGAVLYKSSR